MTDLEKLARKIAAHKMGLVRDPEGQNLPDELWQQAIPQAMQESAHSWVIMGNDFPAAIVLGGELDAEQVCQEYRERWIANNPSSSTTVYWRARLVELYDKRINKGLQ